MVFTFLPFSAFAAAESYVPLYNFPDEAFREYLKKFDTDDDTFLSTAERVDVKGISVWGKGIETLEGIEYFPKLETLYCANNKLTELDVSKNTALEWLKCYQNQLTSLDVSQNTKLEVLHCYENKLTSLDVSKNTQLRALRCSQNNLTSLNVENTKVDLPASYLSKFEAENNTYSIAVGSDRTFDLRTLPGKFDVSKATNWNGGTVSGKTLTVNEGESQVTYTYDCGKGFSRDFTLNVKVGTATPPSGGDTPGGGGDGGGAIVIVAAAGAAVAGVVGYGVYNYVSGQKLQALLPEGVAAPENRAQTALLLWNTAGRLEPAEAPAFADVEDPDTAKAAQWCVEQGLMKRRLNRSAKRGLACHLAVGVQHLIGRDAAAGGKFAHKRTGSALPAVK